MASPFSDQQPGHAGSDSEGLCEAAFPLHAATRLRSRRREDHYLQGNFLAEAAKSEINNRPNALCKYCNNCNNYNFSRFFCHAVRFTELSLLSPETQPDP